MAIRHQRGNRARDVIAETAGQRDQGGGVDLIEAIDDVFPLGGIICSMVRVWLRVLFEASTKFDG